MYYNSYIYSLIIRKNIKLYIEKILAFDGRRAIADIPVAVPLHLNGNTGE